MKPGEVIVFDFIAGKVYIGVVGVTVVRRP